MVSTPQASSAASPLFSENGFSVTIPANATYLPPGQQIIVRFSHPAIRDRQISETIANKCPTTAKILNTAYKLSSQILEQGKQGSLKEGITRGLGLGIPLAFSLFQLAPDLDSSQRSPLPAIEGPTEETRSSASRALVPFTGISTENEIASLISKATLAFSAVLGWATLKNFAYFWERRSLGSEARQLEKSLNGIKTELSQNDLSLDEIESIQTVFTKNIENFKKLSEIGKLRAWPKILFSASALAGTLGYWFAADEVTKVGISCSVFFALNDLVQNGIFTESKVEEETQERLHSELKKLKFPDSPKTNS
jgi:hypothetical protein